MCYSCITNNKIYYIAYRIVKNLQLSRISQFSLKLLSFSHEFQSVLVLVDVVLMQTQKFFHEYSHGDLYSRESFVP